MNYKFRFVIKEYSENIIKLIILFFVSFALSVAGMLWFAQREIIYQTVDIFKAYGLSDKVLINESVFSDRNKIVEDLSLINNCNSVDNAVAENYYRDYNGLDASPDHKNDKRFWFYLYKLPSNISFNPYRMVKGRLPDKPNEIMISSNIVGLDIGDELHDYVYYVHDSEDKFSISENLVSSVKVVGIFDMNNQMPFNPGWTFQGDFSTFENEDGSPIHDMGYAFAVDIVDSKGHIVESDSPCLNIIINVKNGYSTSDVINEIYEKNGLIAYDLTTYKKSVEEYNAEDLMTFRSISLILVVILLTVNVAYGVIGLSVNRKKLSIYYIHGLPWFKAVLTTMFIYCPFVLIGMLAGFSVYYFVGPDLIWELTGKSSNNYLFDSIHLLLVAALIVLSYFLINLSFCMVTFRKTLVDLVRGE